MGVDLMDPVMMQAAWFWTLLILSILVLAVVPHAAMPYSRTGLSLPVYSLFRVEAPCRTRQLFHECKPDLRSGFGSLSVLFPSQPFIKSCPKIRGGFLLRSEFGFQVAELPSVFWGRD